MTNGTRKLVLGAALSIAVGVASADGEPGEFCRYVLEASGEETGTGEIFVRPDQLSIRIQGGFPNTLYTVWIDFQSRATGELPPGYPERGLDRGVTPAFATIAPVANGLRLDPNSVVTGADGNAIAHLPLDYNILQPNQTPVVHENLSMDGLNLVGGFWIREYPLDPDVEASLQMTDPSTGRPLLARSTPAGITVVRHPDMVSHGHTPGTKDVDQFSAFKGDFPAECLP